METKRIYVVEYNDGVLGAFTYLNVALTEIFQSNLDSATLIVYEANSCNMIGYYDFLYNEEGHCWGLDYISEDTNEDDNTIIRIALLTN